MKTLLTSPTPLPEQQEILYQDEDFRQLQRIAKWEAKIKDGVPINEALKSEQPLEVDEDAHGKEEKARVFIEKMQRDTLERNLRFKQEAEKRLAAMELEEKEREKAKLNEMHNQVKKRQQESLIKLQAVFEVYIGEGEERGRARRKTSFHGQSVGQPQAHQASRAPVSKTGARTQVQEPAVVRTVFAKRNRKICGRKPGLGERGELRGQQAINKGIDPHL